MTHLLDPGTKRTATSNPTSPRWARPRHMSVHTYPSAASGGRKAGSGGGGRLPPALPGRPPLLPPRLQPRPPGSFGKTTMRNARLKTLRSACPWVAPGTASRPQPRLHRLPRPRRQSEVALCCRGGQPGKDAGLGDDRKPSPRGRPAVCPAEAPSPRGPGRHREQQLVPTPEPSVLSKTDPWLRPWAR